MIEIINIGYPQFAPFIEINISMAKTLVSTKGDILQHL